MRDFSRRRHFPGTVGGPFEAVVSAANEIEKIPVILFIVLLAMFAFVPNKSDWQQGAGTFAFFLLDWLIISQLSRFRISFGPTYPQVLLLAILRTPFVILPGVWYWGVQIAGSLLVIYGFWFEPQRLAVRIERKASPKLPLGCSIRLLHFGDLHIDRLRRIDSKLTQAIQALKPDIILFSGDTLSYSCEGDPKSWEAANRVFSKLSAPLGVFAVPGSPPVDPDQALEHVYAGTGIKLLKDERSRISLGTANIDVIGLRCSHKPFVDEKGLDSLIHDSDISNFRVLLYHSPDLAPWAAHHQLDMQLSGHTHGGQIRLPFIGALYTSSLYGKKFESGRYEFDSMTLYVTRGIGLEGAGAPRVRFLCPPEITLWELTHETVDDSE